MRRRVARHLNLRLYLPLGWARILTKGSTYPTGSLESVQVRDRRNYMQRKASAVWQGDLKSGKGAISTDSGTLKQTQYSFSTRFENGVETNPEELLAAAHAGRFTLSRSRQLGGAGLTATKLETTCTSTLDKVGDGFSLTRSHLGIVAHMSRADQATFD